MALGAYSRTTGMASLLEDFQRRSLQHEGLFTLRGEANLHLARRPLTAQGSHFTESVYAVTHQVAGGKPIVIDGEDRLWLRCHDRGLPLEARISRSFRTFLC